MRRVVLVSVVLAMGWLVAAGVWAGSAHFVSCNSSGAVGGEVCVTGKEAGLGNLEQVHIVLTVIAHCQNPGGNDPNAQNKETFGAEFDEPVQNGKALFEVCVTTDFQPNCSPPMTVVVDSVSLVDTTNGVSCSQASQ